jgi:hypothetical protein
MIIGYGKITRKEVRKEVRTKVEKVKGGSRIEVQSAGFEHGNFATININGQMVINHETSRRGLNVVAVEPFKHELILVDQYDTYGDSKASKRFVKDIKRLPKGAILVIGCKDECSKQLSGAARDAIKALGSEEIVNLRHRQGFAFIGVVGQIKYLEKRGDIVGTGAILSYAVVERKRETRTKVDGGSSIEIVSAGFKDGNVGKIILNGKDIMTTRNTGGDIKMKDATMSSNYRKGDLNEHASIALDGDEKTYFHTKCGADEWWSASFGDKFLVTEVQIQNRPTGHPNSIKRLRQSEITIEGQYCGTIPDVDGAEGTKWYTVKCESPVAGRNIMVRNTLSKCLHFANIKVVGKVMDPNGSRGINVIALNAKNHEVLLAKSYDTYANDNASADLVADMRGIRRGSIIIAAVKDEASNKLQPEAKELFSKMGSAEINQLGFREGWAFIGVKGQNNGNEKRGKFNEMGLILGYAKRVKKTRTKEEIAAGSSIEIYSAGNEANRSGGENSYAEIRINGEFVVNKQNSKRGINLVVLNGPDHKIILNESYNTFTSKRDDSARLVKDFESIPQGAVIIAAVRDDASKNLKQSARQVFMNMGSQAVKNLGFKQAWGFIGIKGMRRSGEDTGVTVEMGTVLSYTKVVKKRKEVQKVEGGSKIQALSQGYLTGNNARVVVNDEDVLEKAGRGINVVVLAGANHEVILSKSFDTFASSKQAEDMAATLAAIPVGSVIIAAVKDEASKRLSQSAKDIFINMGSKEVSQLGFREGWFFIGIKGTKSHLEKRGADVNGGLILGYSRVVKRTRTKQTKTVTQTRSYKRVIKRVYKKKVVEIVNGVKRTKIITRVQKRTVTCRSTRKITKTKTTARTTVN